MLAQFERTLATVHKRVYIIIIPRRTSVVKHIPYAVENAGCHKVVTCGCVDAVFLAVRLGLALRSVCIGPD